jgi:DNA-directed RNA polymerase subunit RPC12/RpoP
MAYSDVISHIEGLPRYREYVCPTCGHNQRAYALVIQANCEECGARVKLRGYAAVGSEVEDVIDAVLAWLGDGEDFKLAMERKRTLDTDE